MADISNSFRVAVNASKEVILQILINKYKTVLNVSKNTKYFVLQKNNVLINVNEDFDSLLALEDEDAYLYYENNLDFYPEEKDLSVNEQIVLARELVISFKDNNIAAEIIAEFEHLI